MKKLKVVEGGMPLRIDDLDLIQVAAKDNVAALISGLIGSETQCRIKGCEVSINGGSVGVTEGYIFVEDEIFFVPAASFTEVENRPVYLETNFSTDESRTFHDTDTHDVWDIREYAAGYEAAVPEGAILMNDLPRLNDLINENIVFPETISGPCTGTKYEALRKGIKYVVFTPLTSGWLYYISKIKCGTGSGANKTYMVEIKKTDSLFTSGSVVGVYEHVFTSGFPSLHFIPIGFPEGMLSGGIQGSMVIDWDEFTFGTEYTCSLWSEGALAMISTTSTAGTGGGGALAEITAAATLYGEDNFVLVNMSDPGDAITLGDPEDIQGDITLKNIGDADLGVSHSSKLIDGHASILIEKNESISIVCNADSFYVKSGKYILP